ncbi:MAG: hypothetical protein GF330_00005, partial [Candidatus Eisenbacteria bacterium]|nr:hypothetical protein [Candidatus Eisenbacteria bacterium]
RSTFAGWGVDLSRVRFIQTQTYSHWTRDWGPQSVFDGDGLYGITDPIFDGYPWVSGCDMARAESAPASQERPGSPDASRVGSAFPLRGGRTRGWEEDDAVNADLAAELGCPLHAFPAHCTGGNVMTDGSGGAFSTRRMLDENQGLWNEEEFRQLAADYLGIEHYWFLDDPEVYGIQHIDCYAKLLDPETVLIKEVPTWHPEYECVERLVDQVAATTTCYGRPYRIVRIYCGTYDGSAAAGYTNSLILNGKVFVPLFNITWDSAALATYEAAMPGYEVIGFPWNGWYDYDALHCRTMAIFDRFMLRIAHRPLDAELPLAPEFEIHALIDDRSESGLIPDALGLLWRIAGAPDWNWEMLLATAGTDSFAAAIPGAAPGTTIEYYLTAADQSGRVETVPPTAPVNCFRFTITADPSGVQPPRLGPDPITEIRPTPFFSDVTIRWRASRERPPAVRILDCRGRVVRTLRPIAVGGGDATLIWNGRDDRGQLCPAGLYWIRAGGTHAPARKLLRLR